MKICHWFDDRTLELTELDLLGTGSKRLCFAFPGEDKLCVKVARPELPWKVAQKQSFAEEFYLNYLKRRDGRHPEVFPEAFGWVSTNYGPAFVMEKITGPGGETPMTVMQLLKAGLIGGSEARRVMSELKCRAIDQQLLISDWNIANVLLKGKDSDFTPVMVDGFGPKKMGVKGFFFTRFGVLARYKTSRSWEHQYLKVEKSIREIPAGKLC